MGIGSLNTIAGRGLVALLVIGLFGCASTGSTADSDTDDTPQSQQTTESESDDDRAGDEPVELRLTREDLDYLHDTLVEALDDSELAAQWRQRDEAGENSSVGSAGIEADGYDGLAATAESLVNRLEAFFVNEAPVRVQSLRDQEALRRELELQRDVSDPGELPEMLDYDAPDYLMTGTITGQPETIDGTRQAHYRVTLQLIASDSGDVAFETEAHLEKP